MAYGYGYTPERVADGFSRLRVIGFRQFGLVDIDLSGRLTILTGANGAGKTTLLNILGSHFNWHAELLATPLKTRTQYPQFSLDIREINRLYLLESLGLEPLQAEWGADRFSEHPYPHGHSPEEMVTVGDLSYANNLSTPLQIPKQSYSIQYNVYMPGQSFLNGVFISSHRTLSAYQRVQTIPAEFGHAEQLLQEYSSEILSARIGSSTGKSAMLRMKESLLASAIYGEGNSAVVPNAEADKVWNGFQRVLGLLLPESLGFERLMAEPPEIVLQTQTGRFTIDSISGGMAALFELAWQIHLRSSIVPNFTVCFDEPENHLHPSLQRTLIPSLMRAFPDVKFVIASHSPFIVTAAPDARVYVLQYDDDKFVNSVLLDFADKSLTADKTLRDVLGLASTSPVWAEQKFNEIMASFATTPVTGESLRALKTSFTDAGLSGEFPAALDQFLDAGDR